MSYEREKITLFGGVDRVSIMLYLALVMIGFLAIFSASWAEGNEDLLSFSYNYVKQAVWFIISLVFGVAVLLLDVSLWHKIAYYLYGVAILLLVATLLFGAEVNGARAWFKFGAIQLQTMEIVKIALALGCARLMSEYNFSLRSPQDLVKVAALILVPLFIAMLQNDTGSGLVLCSLLFMLYREGLNKWLCIPILSVLALFILSFLCSPTTLLVMLILIFTTFVGVSYVRWQYCVSYVAILFMSSLMLYMLVNIFTKEPFSFLIALLIVTAISLVVVLIYALRARLRMLYVMIALFVASVAMIPTSQAVFSALRPHQQKRIEVFLGLEEDWDLTYNVRQSKIAIGSGGWFGKGYLEGSQIRYGLVPERHTDFIFCTIGEEFGFFGSAIVLVLMFALIFRIMRMGDNQRETFGRVYCYSVASIILLHTLINIGMTIGIMPVVGIPLPLVSYGGSSLFAFTIMIFIAISLDAQTRSDHSNYNHF